MAYPEELIPSDDPNKQMLELKNQAKYIDREIQVGKRHLLWGTSAAVGTTILEGMLMGKVVTEYAQIQ